MGMRKAPPAPAPAPSAHGDGDPGTVATARKLPEVDGGGDPEHLIYVEQSGGLVPYLGRSDKRRVVFIRNVEYQHVSEHAGRWVYRGV